MNDANFKRFFDTYVPALHDAMLSHPDDYGLQPGQELSEQLVAQTANNMRLGFQHKTYNKDGRAVRATCKSLGIKHTYAAINEFLGNAKSTINTDTRI